MHHIPELQRYVLLGCAFVSGLCAAAYSPAAALDGLQSPPQLLDISDDLPVAMPLGPHRKPTEPLELYRQCQDLGASREKLQHLHDFLREVVPGFRYPSVENPVSNAAAEVQSSEVENSLERDDIDTASEKVMKRLLLLKGPSGDFLLHTLCGLRDVFLFAKKFYGVPDSFSTNLVELARTMVNRRPYCEVKDCYSESLREQILQTYQKCRNRDPESQGLALDPEHECSALPAFQLAHAKIGALLSVLARRLCFKLCFAVECRGCSNVVSQFCVLDWLGAKLANHRRTMKLDNFPLETLERAAVVCTTFHELGNDLISARELPARVATLKVLFKACFGITPDDFDEYLRPFLAMYANPADELPGDSKLVADHTKLTLLVNPAPRRRTEPIKRKAPVVEALSYTPMPQLERRPLTPEPKSVDKPSPTVIPVENSQHTTTVQRKFLVPRGDRNFGAKRGKTSNFDRESLTMPLQPKLNLPFVSASIEKDQSTQVMATPASIIPVSAPVKTSQCAQMDRNYVAAQALLTLASKPVVGRKY